MFNLENAISAWRSQMLAARISRDVLAELESHLRDDIARQMLDGVEAQLAFQTATQRLGSSARLKAEFRKLPRHRSLRFWLGFSLALFTAFVVGLNIWISDALREFSLVYCLLLCLALVIFPRPTTNRCASKHRFRVMLASQMSLAFFSALIIFSPLHPFFGLSLAILSCGFFARLLRRQSGRTESAATDAV